MQSESIESQLAEEKCLLEQKYASMLQQVLAEKQLVRFSIDNMSLIACTPGLLRSEKPDCLSMVKRLEVNYYPLLIV